MMNRFFLFLILANSTSLHAQSLEEALERGIAKSLEVKALNLQLETIKEKQVVTGKEYGLKLDIHLLALRDDSRLFDWPINDLTQRMYSDYSFNSSVVNLRALFRPFSELKNIELEQQLEEHGKTLYQIEGHEFRYRKEVDGSLARLWAIKEARKSLDRQVAWQARFTRVLLMKSNSGSEKRGARESNKLLENWIRNEQEHLNILWESEVQHLRLKFAQNIEESFLQEWATEDKFDSFLNVSDVYNSSKKAKDLLAQRKKLESDLKSGDASGGWWNASLGQRYYVAQNVYSFEINNRLDISGEALVRDQFGTDGNPLGYLGAFQEGTLNYAKVDINLWGGDFESRRRVAESEIRYLNSRIDQALREERDNLDEVRSQIEISSRLLATRGENLKILESMERISRLEFKNGIIGPNELIQLEVRLGEESKEILKGRFEMINKIANLRAITNN